MGSTLVSSTVSFFISWKTWHHIHQSAENAIVTLIQNQTPAMGPILQEVVELPHTVLLKRVGTSHRPQLKKVTTVAQSQEPSYAES